MRAIAASRMKKIQEKTFKAKPYIWRSLEILYNLTKLNGRDVEKNPLLIARPVKKIGVLLITPDRGLCGPLIGNIVRQTAKFREREKNKEIKFIVIGKKGTAFLKRSKADILGIFPDKNHWEAEDASPIAHLIISSFEKEEFDELSAIYTNFISASKQEAMIRTILPFTEENLKKIFETRSPYAPEKGKLSLSYKIEPDPFLIIKNLIPKIIQMGIYYLLLETKTSEHAARMIAMQNAKNNAEEMIDDLTLTYNDIRQATITQQLAEIIGGAAALEK